METGNKANKKSSEIAANTLRQLARDGLAPTPLHYAEIYFQMEKPHVDGVLPDLVEVASLFAEMEEDSWTIKQLEDLCVFFPRILLLSDGAVSRQVKLILTEVLTRNRRFLKDVLEDKKQFQKTVQLLNQMILHASRTLESASQKLERNVERLNQSKSLDEAKRTFEKITEESRELLSYIRKVGGDFQKANKQLLASSIEANLDPLTGILNRRGLQRRQGDFVGKEIVLMVFDADHFKALNDQHGHGAGDLFLRQLTSLVSRQLESTEHLFCRWGGDEFMVVFENAKMEDIVSKAEQIRMEVDRDIPSPRIFIPGTKRDHVTISIGLSGGDFVSLTDFDQFFSLADKALYRAKEDGRNTVRAIHPDDRFAR